MIELKKIFFTVFGADNGERFMTTQIVDSIESAKIMAIFLEKFYQAEVMISVGSNHAESEAIYITQSAVLNNDQEERGSVNG